MSNHQNNKSRQKGLQLSTKDLCLTAVFMALTFVVTRFIQIPIPLGYFNIGNTVILLGCLLLPSPTGLLFGSLGSALADLTSYPVYTIPTLIIKFLMPLVFYKLIALKKDTPSSAKKTLLSDTIAAAIATLIPLFGYTLTGGILYGGFAAGLAQFPGLFLEYVANLILISALSAPIRKLKTRL